MHILRRMPGFGRLLYRTFVAIAMGAAVLVPAITFAQEVGGGEPDLRRAPAPWVGFIVMFLLLALVLGVSLMPSKRGHQD